MLLLFKNRFMHKSQLDHRESIAGLAQALPYYTAYSIII